MVLSINDIRSYLGATCPLWLYLATCLVFSSGDTVQDVSANPLRLSVIHKVVLMPLIFAISVRRLFAWPSLIIQTPGPLRFYFAYILVALATLPFGLWPFFSIWKVFEVITAVLAGLGVAVFIGPRRLPAALATVIASILALVWIGVVLSPSRGMSLGVYDAARAFPLQLNGWLIGWNSNSIGVFSALLVLLTAGMSLNWSRMVRITWYFSLACTLFFAQSRTSFGVLGFGIVLLALKRRNYGMLVIVLMLGVGCVMLFSPNPEVLINYITHGKGVDSHLFRNASGRMPMWQYAIDRMPGHWLTGYGFAVGSRYLMMDFGRAECSTMESDFVDSLVSVGIWGPILIAGVYLSNFIALARNRNPFGPRLIGTVAIGSLLVRSLTGTSLASGSLYVLVFTCLAFMVGFSADDADTEDTQLIW